MSNSSDDSSDDIFWDDLETQFDLDADDPLLRVVHFDLNFCNVTQAADLFQPPPFQASRELKRAQENNVRFGKTDDIMKLFAGTSQQEKNYIIGLVSSTLVMGTFFVLWLILSLVMKCMGPRRFGFLCGRFVRPNKPRRYSLNKETDIVVDDALFHEKENPPTPEQSMSQTSEPLEQSIPPISEPLGGPSKSIEKEPVLETPPPTVDLACSENKTTESTTSKAYESWSTLVQHQTKWIRISRGVLFCCLVGVMVAGILFCIQGIAYVKETLDTVQVGVGDIRYLIDTAQVVVSRVQTRQDEIQKSTVARLETLTHLCPNLNPELCQTDAEGNIVASTCNFSVIPFVPFLLDEGEFETVFDAVYKSRNFTYKGFDQLLKEMDILSDTMSRTIEGSLQIEWAFWISYSFTVVLILCCLTMIGGMIVHWRGAMNNTHKQVNRRFTMPLFCVLVTFAFVFACAFVIASIASSDFCIGSPDPKVTYFVARALETNLTRGQILNITNDNRTAAEQIVDQATSLGFGVGFNLANYYINECKPKLFPQGLDTTSSAIVTVMKNVQTLRDQVNAIPQEEWVLRCGSSLAALDKFVESLKDLLCRFENSFEELKRFLWCRRFSPVYQLFMHDAVCEDAVKGLAWIASSMFIIVLLSFVVLLFRAGLFDMEDDETYFQHVQDRRTCMRNVFCCEGYRHNRRRNKEMENSDDGVGGGEDEEEDEIQRAQKEESPEEEHSNQ